MTKLRFRLLAVMLALAIWSPAAPAETVLRVVLHADLKNIDPIWTTAYITRNHAYLVWDTLFSLDENFEPQPQMVDTWTVSDDQLEWTFRLRDGLRWHDGTPVRAEDCVASLERWGKRDGMGQQLPAALETIEAVDDTTIPFHPKYPFVPLLSSPPTLTSNVP